jgi:hypothetical protein
MNALKSVAGTIGLTLAAATTLTVNVALADQGSGRSGANRNNDFVVICHYDRNQRNRNAGPHTIRIDASAMSHHLRNHVKGEGFSGDDYVGECGKPADPVDMPPADEMPF